MGHPKRSKHPSDWSDWEWSEEHNCYNRFRIDSRGKYKWEQYYDQQETTEAAPAGGEIKSSYSRADDSHATQSTPEKDARSKEYGGTEDVTQDFTNMTMDSAPDSGETTPTQTQSPSAATFSANPQVQYGRGNTSDNRSGTFPSNTWNARPANHQAPSKWESHAGNTRITTRNPRTKYEDQDNRFRMNKSDKFKFGKVFKVLWSEPQGGNGTAITGDSFTKVRRFLIIKNFKGHCLCLPIFTYSGQGTLKPGVHAEDHAVIYTDRDGGPYLLRGEVLSKKELRMEPNDRSLKLDPLSRVNYRKVYTVEHNVKVWFIGALTRQAQAQLIADYNREHPPLAELEPEPEYTVVPPLERSSSSTQSNYASATQMSPGGFDQTPRILPGQADYTPISASELQSPSAPTYSYPVVVSSYAMVSTTNDGPSIPPTDFPLKEEDIYHRVVNSATEFSTNKDETPEQVPDYPESNSGEEDLYNA